MNGLLIYEYKEIERNQSFIDRLIQAAKTHGHSLTVIDDNQTEFPDCDFIFFRARNPELSKKLEQRGVPMFNRSEVNVIANDKWKAIQLVQMLGIATVPTYKINDVQDIRDYPVVLKTTGGHGGMQVERFTKAQDADVFLNDFSSQTIIAQAYVETNATDVRVFMLGSEVIGAVKRIGAPNSFKSNFTLGGTVEKYELSTTQEADVIKIAKAIKSDYVGIDFLLLPDGRWVFNELEDPVGARSYYQTTQTDIAIPIMNYVDEQLKKYIER
ncbi:MAG: ATP-grasp domain-containing protein [Psychrobacillus sp.]